MRKQAQLVVIAHLPQKADSRWINFLYGGHLLLRFLLSSPNSEWRNYIIYYGYFLLPMGQTRGDLSTTL